MAYNDREHKKSSQRQFLIKVRGIDGYFAQKTGGEIAAPVSKVWNGGKKKPSLLSSPAEVGNITVTRPYRTYLDDNQIRQLRNNVGVWRTTVSVQPTDVDLNKVGKPEVFPDALLVRMTSPDVDAGSGEGAMWELEFAIGTWA
jgi:hypothetical protein